jgi:replication factor C subunit 2/4
MDSETYNKLRYEQLPWTEKYRPRQINELFSEDDLKLKMKFYVKNKWFPNLIFTGDSGVGKTTTIKCLVKELYGTYVSKNILEMNASDGGVKIMHDEIVKFCKSKLSCKKEDENKYANFKLVIIEAGDNMDENKVQPQINNIMELYKKTVKFIITCNKSSNLIESIQSRCFNLMFERISDDLIIKKLKNICDIEKIKYDENLLKKITLLSTGDMRSAINKLQLVYHDKKNILTHDDIDDICNIPKEVIIKELFVSLINKNLHKSFLILTNLKKMGYSGSDILLGMIYSLNTNICDDINEKIKISLLHNISYASYDISKGVDSKLQLFSCLIKMNNDLEKLK